MDECIGNGWIEGCTILEEGTEGEQIMDKKKKREIPLFPING